MRGPRYGEQISYRTAPGHNAIARRNQNEAERGGREPGLLPHAPGQGAGPGGPKVPPAADLGTCFFPANHSELAL